MSRDEIDSRSAARQLFAELDALQSQCERVLFYQWWPGGLGAELHALSLALTLSFMSNRSLVTQKHGWLYVDAAHCAAADESCYMRPLSSCRAPPPTSSEWNHIALWAGALLHLRPSRFYFRERWCFHIVRVLTHRRP